jgi:hypothetical protein
MAITDEVLDELLKDYEKPEDLLGQNGLLKQGSPLFSVELELGHRHLHLHDGCAEINQIPARRQAALFGERLVERGGRQFEVEFLRQFRDGGDEPLGQVFVVEGRDG